MGLTFEEGLLVSSGSVLSMGACHSRIFWRIMTARLLVDTAAPFIGRLVCPRRTYYRHVSTALAVIFVDTALPLLCLGPDDFGPTAP